MSTPRKPKPMDQVKEDAMPYAADSAAESEPNRGGRPRVFDVATVRLNLFLPEDAAKRIRLLAVEQGISPSQLVDGWARRAELDRAVARGRKAVEEGRTVDQEAAELRLARWA